MTSLPLLALFAVLFAWAAFDAVRDRTPRKPWSYARPALEFWAMRKTRREAARVRLSL